MRTTVVVAASDGGRQLLPSTARDAETVIAADGGLDLAEDLGLRPGLLVGDLDSVTRPALERARTAGVDVREFAADKDLTDLELALAAAAGTDADRTVVLGGAGGRLDHLLANIAVIASSATPIEGWLGTALVVPVAEHWQLDVPEGLLVSLIAFGGDAVVTATGLQWGLADEVLAAGAARGVSNRALGGAIEVTVSSGVVLVVIPDAGVLL